MESEHTYLEYIARVAYAHWDEAALVDYSPTHTAVCYRYTYGEMMTRMRSVATLLRRLGIEQGDHVAVCGANSSHWMISYLAVSSLRAVNVALMASAGAATIVEQVVFSDAKVLITDHNLWQALVQAGLPRELTVLRLDDWTVLQGSPVEWSLNTNPCAEPEQMVFPAVGANDPAQICFTSSTSEKAKGVVASWRNVTCNMLCTSEAYAATTNRVMVSVFPLGHTLAIVGEFLVPLYQGCTLYILRDAPVPDNLLDTYLACKPFEVVLVPMVVERLLSDVYIARFREVMAFLEVGVVCGAKLKREIEDRLMEEHFPLTIPYGMTETCPIVCVNPPPEHAPYSAGHVCRFMEMTIGENDEILVRGDNLMLGYYKNEQATRAKIDEHGWFHTGDCGTMDEHGNLFVRGRLKGDMFVLSSGENISPSALESTINSVAGVIESVVVLREDRLVALVRTREAQDKNSLLASINSLLPAHSRIYDLEFLTQPVERTEKHTIRRYLYR